MLTWVALGLALAVGLMVGRQQGRDALLEYLHTCSPEQLQQILARRAHPSNRQRWDR